MARPRPRTHLRSLLTLALGCAAVGVAAEGCSSSSSGSGGPFGFVGTPTPAVTGAVYAYTDAPARGVPVSVLGQSLSGTSRLDGLFQLGPVPTGAQVLRVGDSKTTPTLLVPFTGTTGQGTFLDRPVFLPSLESGVGANVPGSIAAVTTISGDALPGVVLRLDAGTSVSNFAGEVLVLAVSPSRLPVPVLGGDQSRSEPRAAFLVEPHGVTFSPPATLTVPRQDALSAAPFDVYKVERGSGRWVKTQTGIATVATDSLTIEVSDGTLYAVVPRAAPATVTLTGRIVAGTQPVAGYRASCWNRVSEPTAADGTFEIKDVPSVYSAFLVRAHPERPGFGFAPEVVATTAGGTALGDLSVAGRAPDGIRPTVRATSPSDGQSNVDRRAQVVVTFSEAIDPATVKPFKLVGTRGEVAGVHRFDNAFTVRFRPQENLDPSETYTIFVEPAVTDLAGNAVEDQKLTFKFTTRGGAPDPPPTDTQAFGLSPLSGARGDTVTIPGRNYTGGTVVSFGGTQGLVLSETTDTIQARVPDFQPAGDVTVSLSAGGQGIATLQPLVLDLRATVATVFSGTTKSTPLAFLDRAQPPPAIVVDGGNVGGTQVTIDGVSIAAVDSVVMSGGVNVATGRTISLPAPAPATLLTGPVVLRGSNGEPSGTYRFILVRE